MQLSQKLRGLISEINYNDFAAITGARPTNVDYLDYDLEGEKLVVTGLPTNVKGVADPFDHSARQPVKLASFLQKAVSMDQDRARRLLEQITATVVMGSKSQVEIVSGEELRECYDHKNYVSSGGNIASCMSGKEMQDYLDFYAANSDTIKLAVTRRKGKVAGRALIFMARTGYQKGDLMMFMGRRYVVSTVDRTALETFAEKECQGLLERSEVVKGAKKGSNIFVPVEHCFFNVYPYADHFYYLYPDDKVLTWVAKQAGVGMKPHIGVGRSPTWNGLTRPKILTNPCKPNKVWSEHKRQWIDKGKAVLYNGEYYPEGYIGDCAVCERKYVGDGRKYHKGGFLCGNHKSVHLGNGVYATFSEAVYCQHCGNASLKAGGTEKALARKRKCGGRRSMVFCAACMKRSANFKCGCCGEVTPSAYTNMNCRVPGQAKTGRVCTDCYGSHKYKTCRCGIYSPGGACDECPPVVPPSNEAVEKDDRIETGKYTIRIKL